MGRVRDDRPRILVVDHLGRGQSALANGHGGEAPRGSVDSGLVDRPQHIELVASDQQRAFGQAKADTLPAYCRDCDVRFACHGGCPKDRFTTTPDGEPGLNYLCPSFKRFFAHVAEPMDQMARLLARGRAPSKIVGRYATADADRGRNEPCTCDSGRKWKHCHGTAPTL